MPVMVQLNLATGKDEQWSDQAEQFLIAVFNKCPKEITAENILQRQYRPWLIRIVEDVNMKAFASFDVLDVVNKLQKLRKSNKLRNRASAVTESIGVVGDDIDAFDPSTSEV